MKCSLQEDMPQLWSSVVSRLAEMYLIYEVAPTDNRVVEYVPQNQIDDQPALVQNP